MLKLFPTICPPLFCFIIWIWRVMKTYIVIASLMKQCALDNAITLHGVTTPTLCKHSSINFCWLLFRWTASLWVCNLSFFVDSTIHDAVWLCGKQFHRHCVGFTASSLAKQYVVFDPFSRQTACLLILTTFTSTNVCLSTNCILSTLTLVVVCLITNELYEPLIGLYWSFIRLRWPLFGLD